MLPLDVIVASAGGVLRDTFDILEFVLSFQEAISLNRGTTLTSHIIIGVVILLVLV